ncbi:MAG: sigma 54-interacting transcriptional regulator [Planctomycetia bacterium]|nr:sigma 54-interacting transcriptional regulator [Planctomycetia bacterium]
MRPGADLPALLQASARINATLDLDRVLEATLATMDELFGFRHSLVLLPDPDGRTLSVAAERGYGANVLGARVPFGTGTVGVAARRRRIVRVGSLSRHRAYAAAVRTEVARSAGADQLDDLPRLPGLPDVETQIAIPLVFGPSLVGVFAVESAEDKTFSEKDEHLAGLVGNLAASAVHNALLHRELGRANDGLRSENATLRNLRAEGVRPLGIEDIVGESKAVKGLRRLLRKVAATTSSTVLITGENGTGKDLAAKVIHSESSRASGPFMNITCSALPEALLESELFGHEKGAFTDARSQKKGLLELADGGTVFLDEIGEMSLVLQAKLLRFLEEKEFRRVGGTRDLRVDVRVLAATNRDLRREVREGRFREDLYYRLRVLPVEIPPLRERTGDVPVLVQMFARQFCAEFRKDPVSVSPEALARLEACPWPGNVRELRNAVERAVLLADGPALGPGDFDMISADEDRDAVVRLPPGGIEFEKLEKELVLLALERSGYNKSRAARLLHMDRDWLRYRMEKHGIHAPGKAGRPSE